MGGFCRAIAGCGQPGAHAIIEHMFDEQPGLQVRPTSSFPSPAQDYGRGPVSLDRALIGNPAATFVLRVEGDGLRSGGVLDGDELVVDRALDPRAGHVVVVVIEGQHRVGRLLPAVEVGQHLNQIHQPSQTNGMTGRDGICQDGAGHGPRTAAGRAGSGLGRGPWSGPDGWCLATDDLVLPIPSGSVFFGVARYAIHHLRAELPAYAPQVGPDHRIDGAGRTGRAGQAGQTDRSGRRSGMGSGSHRSGGSAA